MVSLANGNTRRDGAMVTVRLGTARTSEAALHRSDCFDSDNTLDRPTHLGLGCFYWDRDPCRCLGIPSLHLRIELKIVDRARQSPASAPDGRSAAPGSAGAPNSVPHSLRPPVSSHAGTLSTLFFTFNMRSPADARASRMARSTHGMRGAWQVV